MNILVVDDEQLVLENLVEAIKEVQPHAKIFNFTSPIKALDFCKEHPCDIAFIDIEMGVMNGIDFAKKLKIIHPLVNLIFATGYLDYSLDAFELHASGYLIKPITPEKIKEELENLRHLIEHQTKKHILIHTFGNFEIYVNNKPLNFKYEKTKELVAYLVDRNETFC